MQNHITTSIVLYGKINQNYSNNWGEFHNNAKDFITKLGFRPTHIGIFGQSFKTGKINDINKIENKLVKSLERMKKFLPFPFILYQRILVQLRLIMKYI